MYAADEAAVCVVVSAGKNGVTFVGQQLGEREGFKIACKSVSAGVRIVCCLDHADRMKHGVCLIRSRTLKENLQTRADNALLILEVSAKLCGNGKLLCREGITEKCLEQEDVFLLFIVPGVLHLSGSTRILNAVKLGKLGLCRSSVRWVGYEEVWIELREVEVVGLFIRQDGFRPSLGLRGLLRPLRLPANKQADQQAG